MYNVKGEIIMTREANPIPQGKYVPATRFGNMIFTAGMTPRNNGVLLKTGKIKATDEIADYKEAVVQAAKNALTAAKNKLENGEKNCTDHADHRLCKQRDRFHKTAEDCRFCIGVFL